MSIVSLAIIGKNNEPLYLRQLVNDEPSENDLFGLPAISQDDRVCVSDNTTTCSIRHQFILNEALERLKVHEESGFAWRASGATGSGAMFVGLLYPIEEMRVYGQSKVDISSRVVIYRPSVTSFCLFIKTNTSMRHSSYSSRLHHDNESQDRRCG